MKNEFKAGDLVFELDFHAGIKLEVLKRRPNLDGDANELSTRYGLTYSQCGKAYPSFKVPHLLRATPENRQALVTLYGEDAVPKLQVKGSELTKKLLEKHKYVMCWVCKHSDEQARKWPQGTCIATAVEDDGFTLADGGFAEYAVPVDMNGNEITEIE